MAGKTTDVQESVSDMLKVVTTSLDQMREAQTKAVEQVNEVLKELARVVELHKDFIREQDRLSSRMSTQLRVLVTENQKKASE